MSKPKTAADLPSTALIKEKGRGLVPASSHGHLDIPFNDYLNALDVRGKGDDPEQTRWVQQALAASPDARFNEFLSRALGNHLNGRMSLATIAKQCGITLMEFMEFVAKGQNARILAKAQTATVEVIGDMAQDARTKDVVCGRCDGYGVLLDELRAMQDRANDERAKGKRVQEPEARPCPNCQGTGKAKKVGDTDSRKLLLETAGVIGKGKGPSIVLNQNFGGNSMESAVGKLNSVSFDLEFGSEGGDVSGLKDNDVLNVQAEEVKDESDV